jgi:3,8-divinyl chlorophyllide a/chlorophyllide a reductase subunit Y
MRAFFDGVGAGHAAGIWGNVPQDRPEFRERYQRQLAAKAKSRKAEEMI